MFRLGRKTKQVQSTSTPQPSGSSAAVRPRPILIKLNCPWDRRIILAGKKKLSGVEGMDERDTEMHTLPRKVGVLVQRTMTDFGLSSVKENLSIVSYNCHGFLSYPSVLLDS